VPAATNTDLFTSDFADRPLRRALCRSSWNSAFVNWISSCSVRRSRSSLFLEGIGGIPGSVRFQTEPNEKTGATEWVDPVRLLDGFRHFARSQSLNSITPPVMMCSSFRISSDFIGLLLLFWRFKKSEEHCAPRNQPGRGKQKSPSMRSPQRKALTTSSRLPSHGQFNYSIMHQRRMNVKGMWRGTWSIFAGARFASKRGLRRTPEDDVAR